MANQNLSCAYCEAPLPEKRGKGRVRRFCSEACKKAAKRQRQNDQRRKSGQRHCRHCGETFEGKGAFCSDRCYYYAHRDDLPFNKSYLRPWDEDLIPLVPIAQQKALDLNRPKWHARVYGGRKGRGHA